MPVHNHRLYVKKSQKDLLAKFCSVFAVLMPLTTLPQITLLYTEQNAGGLSLWMWILYTVGVIPFLLFGIVNKIVHLVILNTLWLIVQVIMVVGILLYR